MIDNTLAGLFIAVAVAFAIISLGMERWELRRTR